MIMKCSASQILQQDKAKRQYVQCQPRKMLMTNKTKISQLFERVYGRLISEAIICGKRLTNACGRGREVSFLSGSPVALAESVQRGPANARRQALAFLNNYDW
jgi:hypothetical protein